MDQSVFASLLAHLKKASLAADKFYLLQRATSSLFFSPAQCLDVVRCFTHSEDKAAIIEAIEKRLCTKVEPKFATWLVKAAAFSKDRLRILRALLKHLQEMTHEEAKAFVASCFDSEKDRAAAWAILRESFEFLPADEKVSTVEDEKNEIFKDDAAPFMIFQYIENMAKSNAQPVSAFDLPLLDELSLLRKTILEQRQAITDQVEKRHRDGHHFVVPSRISAITRNLRPGRISAIADRTCAKESTTAHWTSVVTPEPEPVIPEESHYSVTVAKHVNTKRGITRTNTEDKIWNIVNPAYTSPLAAYYLNKNVGMVR